MSFTPDEIEAMEQTAEALEWWAEVGWQYTMTNCEAHKMSVPDIIYRIARGVSPDDNNTCRYQISLLRALSKFETFYERMLHDNEAQAKYIKGKYDRLNEYTKDTYKPGLPDPPAPWIARTYADDLAKTLRNISKMSRKDLEIQKPTETERKAAPSPIHIQDFHGILGDVQAENVQTGDYASIQKQPKVEEQNKSPLVRVLHLLGWLWTQVKWLWANVWLK